MADELPRAAEPGHDAPELAEARSVLLEQDFDGGSLYALRAAVAAHAAEAGLSGTRLYDVVTAAHELAANAVRHGAGNGRLSLWVADGALHCQVHDTGPSTVTRVAVPPAAVPPAAVPPAGGTRADAGASAAAARPASWPAEHGHGLWVLGQVADQFTIDRGSSTTATAAFYLGASRPGPGESAGG
jgi:anti-sigma regulatory factor (Ser/Thr protein kinase)